MLWVGIIWVRSFEEYNNRPIQTVDVPGIPKDSSLATCTKGARMFCKHTVVDSIPTRSINKLKEKYATGLYSHRKLGDEYGMNHSIIGDLLRGQTFKI